MPSLQFVCLVFAIWLTLANGAKFLRGSKIEAAGFGLQAFSIAGFVYLTWL